MQLAELVCLRHRVQRSEAEAILRALSFPVRTRWALALLGFAFPQRTALLHDLIRNVARCESQKGVGQELKFYRHCRGLQARGLAAALFELDDARVLAVATDYFEAFGDLG